MGVHKLAKLNLVGHAQEDQPRLRTHAQRSAEMAIITGQAATTRTLSTGMAARVFAWLNSGGRAQPHRRILRASAIKNLGLI